MNLIISIVLSFTVLMTTPINDFCSPVRRSSSELVNVHPKSNISYVKGYFIPHDGSKERLAKFKVLQSSDSHYEEGHVYPVYEYGPFGSSCEVYEMGESPLDDELCGPTQVRYIIHYNNRGASERIVTPIFHGKGLRLNTKSRKVYDYKEETDVTTFEAYVFKASETKPIWSALK